MLSQESGEKAEVCGRELDCLDVIRTGKVVSLNNTCLEV